MTHQKNLILFILLALPALANDIEPLKSYTQKRPLFLSDKHEAAQVASRCSALYLVLDARLIDLRDKDLSMKKVIDDLDEKAFHYHRAGSLILSQSKTEAEQGRTVQKAFTQHYGDLTLKNWKANNNIFKGSVGEDLSVCDQNYVYFKKLSITLARDLKRPD